MDIKKMKRKTWGKFNYELQITNYGVNTFNIYGRISLLALFSEQCLTPFQILHNPFAKGFATRVCRRQIIFSTQHFSSVCPFLAKTN